MRGETVKMCRKRLCLNEFFKMRNNDLRAVKTDKIVCMEIVKHPRGVETALVDGVCKLLHGDAKFFPSCRSVTSVAHEACEFVAWLFPGSSPWHSSGPLCPSTQQIVVVEPENKMFVKQFQEFAFLNGKQSASCFCTETLGIMSAQSKQSFGL